MEILIQYVEKLEFKPLTSFWQESDWRMEYIQDQSFG